MACRTIAREVHVTRTVLVGVVIVGMGVIVIVRVGM
jgi:hypothetical protein